MNPMQIELIKKFSKQPIVINQVQFNLVNAGIIDCGINVNMTNNEHFLAMHYGCVPIASKSGILNDTIPKNRTE